MYKQPTITIYLRNMKDRSKIVSVRKEYFGTSKPTSTIVRLVNWVKKVYLLKFSHCIVEKP